MTTKDTTPQPVEDAFDIEAWLAGASRPETVVMLSSKGHEYGEYKKLELQLQAAQKADDDEFDQRLGSGAEARRIASEMDALSKVIDAGRRPFRLRGLAEVAAPGDTQPDLQTIRKQSKDLDQDGQNAALLAACCIDPVLTPAKWSALRAALGEGQWVQLIREANRVSFADAVDAPFSVAASVALAADKS